LAGFHDEVQGTAKMNLAPVGYDVDVDLQGTVEIHTGQGPLVVLLAEAHNDNNVIGQNLHSTINLIDADVVGLVGVEEFCSIDVKEELMHDIGPRKAGSLAAYGKTLKDEFGGDAGIIAGIRKQKYPPRMGYAKHLAYMRPGVPLVGVEDKELRLQTQRDNQAAATLFPEEKDETKRKKLQIAEFRSIGVERELKRDAAFLRLAREAHAALGSPGALVINGGGLHMKRIAETLRKQSKAFLLILPDGYTDALD
jgi:hypothetical protein